MVAYSPLSLRLEVGVSRCFFDEFPREMLSHLPLKYDGKSPRDAMMLEYRGELSKSDCQVHYGEIVDKWVVELKEIQF